MTANTTKELIKAKNTYLKANKALQKRILALNDIMAGSGAKMLTQLPKITTMPQTVTTYQTVTKKIKDLLKRTEYDPAQLKTQVIKLAAKITDTPTIINKRGHLQANLTALSANQRILYNRCWQIITRGELPLYQALIQHFARYDPQQVSAMAIDLLSSGDYHKSDLTTLITKMTNQLEKKE